ncbi:MAG: hypothetical protein NQU42_07680 [Methanothrix sp.]|uniref:hypothetical protein n=1 Tax=Methanothrix sp. TaxID=90426 RepID=UPI0025E27C65|nr:hypothetical protein [Methanothrix sp.]MCQ8903954.1 hypothetical protein [Methanothrix sp.]
MVRADKRTTDRCYRERIRSSGLDGRMMAELDALSACHPGCIAGFLESLAPRACDGCTW